MVPSIGDIVLINGRLIRVDEIFFFLSEKKEKQIERIDFYISAVQRFLEVEIFNFPKIEKIIPKAELKNFAVSIEKLQKENSSPTFSDEWGVILQKKESHVLPCVASVKPLDTCEDVKVINVAKLAEGRRFAYIQRIASKKKQAIAILFELRLLTKKNYEGLRLAERYAQQIGLNINRSEFQTIRSEYQELKKKRRSYVI